MIYRSTLRGCGLYAPARVMTNDEVATMVETSDEWIYSRTGIRRRHIAASDETTGTMAIHAARTALASSGVPASEIGLVIVATSTPDYAFPASACLVQDALGVPAGACDLEAACSGFVYALAMACGLIGIGAIEHALVIGSEVFSRVLDWTDRRTCILFGDGAGAVVVSRSMEPGLLPQFQLGADGAGGPLLTLPSGSPSGAGSRPPVVGMNGPETFKFGVRVLAEVAESLLLQGMLTPRNVEWLVPHQANGRIISSAAKRAGFAEEQVMNNIEEYGNTSAASIPLAIADWQARGLLHAGDRLLTVGFGAGLTWAGGLVGWRD